MKKLAIFDLDGTLIDSLTDVALCFNEALSRCGFPERPVGDYARYVGGNLEQVIARLLPERRRTQTDIARVRDVYRPLYLQSPKEHTRPFPGITELLRELASRGVLLAVNTNKAQALTDAVTDKLFAGVAFADVVGYRDDLPSKPDPAGVYRIMRRAKVRPEDAVYIGDGESDVATAHAAGISMLFVTWGQGMDVARDDPRIDGVAHTPRDVLRHLTL